MNIWMIHEISDDDVNVILDFLNPSIDILFFDDAVLSQYRILNIKQSKNFKCIIGVSVDIASKAKSNNKDLYPYKTSILHEKWHHNGCTKGFMSWNDIMILYNNGVDIAYHGTSHDHLISDMKTYYYDIERGYNIFIEKMNMKPKYYVYPYNESSEIADSIIRSFDMIPIGKGRIDFATYKSTL